MTKRLYTLYPFSVLLLGLILAQVLATVQVYLSNASLYDNLTAIRDAGYLAMPNSQVMQRLHQFKPAFCGGLFFTFSIGAGISFLSLGCAWIWERLFNRKRNLLYLFLFIWLALLIALNIHGFKPVVNLYFLVIPPAVFTAAVWCMFHLNRQETAAKEIIHIAPVIVLAILLQMYPVSRRGFQIIGSEDA